MTIKKISLSLVSVALIASFSGCGSSSSDSSNTTPTTPAQSAAKTVKVVDGYIMGSTVCDAFNVCAQTDLTGSATADFNLSTVLTATAGMIDTNNDGIANDTIISKPLKGVVGKTVISPMTDLIANGADADKLADVLGLSSTDALYADPIATNNVNLEKAIQLVYAAKLADVTTKLATSVNAHTIATTDANATTAPSALPAFGDKVAPKVTPAPVEKNATANGSSLPDFTTALATTASNQIINIDALANMVLSATDNNPTVATFVQAVKDANVSSAGSIEATIATQQENLVKTLAPTDLNPNANDVSNASPTTTDANATATTDVNTTMSDANATASDVNTTVNNASGSALPNFGDTTTKTTTTTAKTKTTKTTKTTESNTSNSNDTNNTTSSTTSSNNTGSALPNF